MQELRAARAGGRQSAVRNPENIQNTAARNSVAEELRRPGDGEEMRPVEEGESRETDGRVGSGGRGGARRPGPGATRLTVNVKLGNSCGKQAGRIDQILTQIFHFKLPFIQTLL